MPRLAPDPPADVARLIADIADALQCAVVLSQGLTTTLANTRLATDSARLEDAVKVAACALRELARADAWRSTGKRSTDLAVR